jgi:hypothetical protein
MQLSKREIVRAYQAITKIQSFNEKQPEGFNYFLEKNRRLLETECAAIVKEENSTLKEYNKEMNVQGADAILLAEKYNTELTCNKLFLDSMTEIEIYSIKALPDGLPSLFYSWLFPLVK